MNALWRKSAMFFWQNAVKFRWRSAVTATAFSLFVMIWISVIIHPPLHLKACRYSSDYNISITPASDGTVTAAFQNMAAHIVTIEQQRLCNWQVLSVGFGISKETHNHIFEIFMAFAGGILCYIITRMGMMKKQIVARRCFEHAEDGLLLVRVSGNGQFFFHERNASWRRLPAALGRVVIGRQPHDIWPQAVADGFVRRFKLCVATGRPLHYETTWNDDAKSTFWIVITPLREVKSTIKFRRERIVLLMCQARDVTEQLGLYQQIYQEQSTESFRRLAAGVAHDFNNILQAISSALDLILEDVSAIDQNSELALTALTAAQRGSQLTQNLLAYSNKQGLAPGAIDLRQWLPKIAPTLEDAIGPTNRLVLIFAGPPAIAYVDASGLHTALLNLALNAGRGMAEGGLLRIETDCGGDPENETGRVRIKICDTRTGLDSITLDGYADTYGPARSVSGPGLALSMAEAFATQSGGSLRLLNRLGEGTTAILTLPAHLAAERYLSVEQRPFEQENRVPAAIGA